ncbi:hypothetical protein I3843_05G209500 [Carya illinoinensis]|nr:hypothetical protein I3843_05G209500 [Carya illinoinensis]KAG7980976.1 hypothetical protein I3843_05G209500 [Carya illinoinensis]KAG7980977.1 hypothetical protein I3843_05G209500 [Carya illinoinensis]KAG7980978.1 hypothetical protein I3843_05G209500 [Carya illinoinensis]
MLQLGMGFTAAFVLAGHRLSGLLRTGFSSCSLAPRDSFLLQCSGALFCQGEEMYWPVDVGAAEEIFGLCFLLSILDIFVLRSRGKRSSQGLCFLPTVVCCLDHLDRFSLSCVVEEEMPVEVSVCCFPLCVLALLLIVFCCGLPLCKRKSSSRALCSLPPVVYSWLLVPSFWL